MRVRTLLPALLAAALLPGTAHASPPDQGSGIECSVGPSVSPSGGSWVGTVYAVWAVPHTGVTHMVLDCSVSSPLGYEGSFHAATSRGPVLHLAEVATFQDTSELHWCMTLTTYDAADTVLDVHSRCYVQGGV